MPHSVTLLHVVVVSVARIVCAGRRVRRRQWPRMPKHSTLQHPERHWGRPRWRPGGEPRRGRGDDPTPCHGQSHRTKVVLGSVVLVGRCLLGSKCGGGGGVVVVLNCCCCCGHRPGELRGALGSGSSLSPRDWRLAPALRAWRQRRRRSNRRQRLSLCAPVDEEATATWVEGVGATRVSLGDGAIGAPHTQSARRRPQREMTAAPTFAAPDARGCSVYKSGRHTGKGEGGLNGNVRRNRGAGVADTGGFSFRTRRFIVSGRSSSPTW